MKYSNKKRRVKNKKFQWAFVAVLLFLAVSAAQGNVKFTTLDAAISERQDYYDISSDWGEEFVPGEILAKLTTNIEYIDELNKRFKVNEIKRLFSNIYKLTLPSDADILSIVKEYEANPNVEYAEPNGIYHTLDVPNDANYTKQWAHQNIQSEIAWDTETGDPEVVIAVVDTGVDWDHPDLAANIWNNTDEWDVYPYNGTDDDNNGYIDDVRGWDFVNTTQSVWLGEDGEDPDNDPMDFDGHGTHCSGIAAAVTNNSIGIAGVSWSSKIMALRAGYKNWVGVGCIEWADAAEAIVYAADNGADIVSMSFGGAHSDTVYQAVTYAYYNKSVLLIAAAGNEATSDKVYPAAYDEVVAVTATDESDNPAWFTSFGDWVEVAAPGVYVYSTMFNDTYAFMSGTSMSTPHVAGVAALIWSQFPNMTRDQVRLQLHYATDDLGDPGFDVYYGYGRVNARWSVQAQPNYDLRLWGLKMQRVLKPGDSATINSSVLNFGKSNESDIAVRLLVNGSILDTANISFLASRAWTTVICSWTPTDGGWYNVTSFVVPVEYENITSNNAISARVLVRVEEVIWVPGDYPSIQRAINAAPPGYVIKVASGTYIEHVIVNKLNLTLMGESRDNTVVEATWGIGSAILVTRDNANITEFSLKNGVSGILLDKSSGNSISRNTISNNFYGIWLYLTTSNTVVVNNVLNNSIGLYLIFSQGDTVVCNNVSDNDCGIWLQSAWGGGNTIYHNNFINNTDQILYLPRGEDTWNDGAGKGNYWSDYNGTDLNGDGVGDTDLPHQDVDYYPLMSQWLPIHDIAVTSVTHALPYGASAVYPGWGAPGKAPVSINVIVKNQADFYETFNVTARYDNNTIGTKTVTSLAPGEAKTLTFRWNTAGVDPCTYNYTAKKYLPYKISAEASAVPGEVYTYDNKMVDGTVTVRIPADANGDGHVRADDLGWVGWCWYQIYPYPGYDWRADFNGDGSVKGDDLGILGWYWYKYSEAASEGGGTTKIYVDPQIATAAIGDTFTINITVSDVSNLYCWSAGIDFNASVLECLSFEEGPFLKQGGSTASVSGTIDNGNGTIYPPYGYTLTGSSGGVNGTGALASVTFKVIGLGDSYLNLTNMELYNMTNGEAMKIPFEAINGHFEKWHDVAVINVTLSYDTTVVYPTWVDSPKIKVAIKNEGLSSETFNVTTYYKNATGTYTIGTQTVTNLAPGANTTLTFTWDVPPLPGYPDNPPAAWPYPTYTISANASVVSHEVDTSDNSYVYGTIKVQWPGDANGDGHVNGTDQEILGAAWYKKYGEPGYDPRADFNGDGIITSSDMGILYWQWYNGPLD